MIEFVPFEPRHLQEIDAPTRDARHWIENADASGLVNGYAWSCLRDGACVGSAGVLPVWQWRALAWSFFGRMPANTWPAITRKTVRVLDQAHEDGLHRIEMSVIMRFPAGHRWAEMLGFTYEGPMAGYGARGETYALYGRVRYASEGGS
ncbi:hypothetical protein [Fodinicurvata sediminis]|uniref:hypothetical protein n=1 Tax=Fodinicurvata sediminis TaxID=1121832 RepID=UPI0003B3F87C|nr:hypothetical protein [Fodinicurvata sediminis]